MNLIELVVLVGVSFTTGFLFFPYFIREFKKRGIITQAKKSKDEVLPTNGGLAVIILYLILISIFSIYPFNFNFGAIIALTLFAVFGLIYSLIRVPPAFRFLLPLFFSLPLVPLISETSLQIPFLGSSDFGLFYLYVIMPVFIAMYANLINFRTDYNGMPSYTGLIILTSIIAISANQNTLDSIAFLIPFFGLILAFSYFNYFPAKIFEGHIGIVLGGAIGIAAVLLKLEAIALVMVIPHLVNFFLYIYWRIRDIPDILFPEILDDGTLKVYGPVSLKWFLPYYFKVNEIQSVFFMHIVTAIFCTIAIVIEIY